MVVSFNQPAFIPWGGFFARLMMSDTMVLLDETLFARGFTFVNKNRIKGPEHEVWLTIPLLKKGRGRQRISELEIYRREFWSEKFATTLYHMYGRSVFFDEIAQPLVQVAQADDVSFINTVGGILEILRKRIGIESGFTWQSALGIEATGIQLLVSIAKELEATEVILPFGAQRTVDWRQFEALGMKVWFLKFAQAVYPQFWGRFRANLSVLDTLLCMGLDGKRVLERSLHLVR